MSTAVAWIDVLGFASFSKRHPKVAAEHLQELRACAKECLCHRDTAAKLYGVNDGFYAISNSGEALLAGLAALYRHWFDKYSSQNISRPLLRGGVSAADVAILEPTDGCVRLWLEGHGIRSAYEAEELLRGGRLFCETELKKAARQAGLELYDWQGLTSWEPDRDLANKKIFEVLWPAEGDVQQVEIRAKEALRLYEEALTTFLELEKEPRSDPKKIMPAFLQFDETLKLILRSVGRWLRNHKGDESRLYHIIERLREHRPDQFRFTWGLTFVALEAVFIGQLSNAPQVARRVAEYLGHQRTDDEQRKYVCDFERELRRPSYAKLNHWYIEASREAV